MFTSTVFRLVSVSQNCEKLTYFNEHFKNHFLTHTHTQLATTRAANSVDFCIEFKFEFKFRLFCEFEFGIFIFSSLSSNSSPVKIYQVLSSSENKVIDSA